MSTNFMSIKIGEIDQAQFIRVPVVGGVLDIYTGTAMFNIKSDNELERWWIDTLLPMNGNIGQAVAGNIQVYPGRRPSVAPVATASLASYGQHAATAAVDNASPILRRASPTDESAGGYLALVVNVAVANGVLNRFAYQVSVFVAGSEEYIKELDKTKYLVDPDVSAEDVSSHFKH